jgi:hypothetical protein
MIAALCNSGTGLANSFNTILNHTLFSNPPEGLLFFCIETILYKADFTFGAAKAFSEMVK